VGGGIRPTKGVLVVGWQKNKKPRPQKKTKKTLENTRGGEKKKKTKKGEQPPTVQPKKSGGKNKKKTSKKEYEKKKGLGRNHTLLGGNRDHRELGAGLKNKKLPQRF